MQGRPASVPARMDDRRLPLRRGEKDVQANRIHRFAHRRLHRILHCNTFACRNTRHLTPHNSKRDGANSGIAATGAHRVLLDDMSDLQTDQAGREPARRRV